MPELDDVDDLTHYMQATARLTRELDELRDRFGRGPHLLTDRDGRQALCGGPGYCRACDAALTPADAVLSRELGETRILLDGARAALRTANDERAKVEAVLAATTDALRAILAHADGLHEQRDKLVGALHAVAKLVPTRGAAAGCPVSPDDPQTREEREGGAVPG